jgi:hypothetical protein
MLGAKFGHFFMKIQKYRLHKKTDYPKVDINYLSANHLEKKVYQYPM